MNLCDGDIAFAFTMHFPPILTNPYNTLPFEPQIGYSGQLCRYKYKFVFMIYNNGFVCRNFVVQTMPTPLYDAMSASKLNPEKTEAALQTVSINCLRIRHLAGVTQEMSQTIRSHCGIVGISDRGTSCQLIPDKGLP